MVEMFEIDEEAITLEARLYEDLDFDSIDAVDMTVRLKEMTGKAVKPEDFKAALSLMWSKQFITYCMIDDRRKIKNYACLL